MSPPLPTVSVQGLGVVPADLLNTFEQVLDSLATLRSFVPVSGMGAFVQGFSTPGDGGAGPFWWNAQAVSANYVDDGANTIVPPGVVMGVWLRLGYLTTATPYSYQVPSTAFAIVVPPGVGSLILNPAGTLASGSVTLSTPPRDGWMVRISSSQAVTAFSVGAQAGAVVSNAPTTLAAGGVAGFQYVAGVATWFRI